MTQALAQGNPVHRVYHSRKGPLLWDGSFWRDQRWAGIAQSPDKQDLADAISRISPDDKRMCSWVSFTQLPELPLYDRDGKEIE